MTRPPLHVAIVGYGTAGQAAAILLSRDGHRVEVFERAPKLGPVGAGLLLQPTGLHVLWQMGLLDEYNDVTVPDRKVYTDHSIMGDYYSEGMTEATAAPSAPVESVPVESVPLEDLSAAASTSYDVPPTYDAPTYDAPTYDAPTFDAPSYDVPPTYDGNTPVHLLVGLHGCGDNAQNFASWAVNPFDTRKKQEHIGISIGGRDGQCWQNADEPTVQVRSLDVYDELIA